MEKATEVGGLPAVEYTSVAQTGVLDETHLVLGNGRVGQVGDGEGQSVAVGVAVGTAGGMGIRGENRRE